MSSRATFASRTAYEGLQVDSGESDTEDELTPAEDSTGPATTKPTKSALKKLAKLARIEKREQAKREKLEKKAQLAQQAQDAIGDTAAATEESQSEPIPEAPLPPPKDEPTMPSEPQSNPATATPSMAPLTTPVLPPAAQNNDSSALKNVILEEKELPVANPPLPQPIDAERAKKRASIIERTTWTLIMIFGFIALLLLGPGYMVLLVMACQALVYREVTALFTLTSKQEVQRTVGKRKDPWSKTLSWYFFAVTNYFLYGESIIYYFKHVVFIDRQLTTFANNHRLSSFSLYTLGIMGFVMSLKKGYLKQQFGLFCWVHMSLLLIVVSSHFIVNNILEGMIWFWVPASLVICNDIFAYIWGMTLGRTPLIELSPKKTVEGFVGAFISTMLFSQIWGIYFMRFDYMICPVHELGANAFNSLSCTPNSVFVWQEATIPGPVASALSTLLGRSITTLPWCPYQIHLLALAFFASVVAPFGGFFASGFKRAFDIKDFGHSIPGHGGMTDRMDCQFLMGVFTYVYYSSLIRQLHVTVGSLLQTIVSGLTTEQQLELVADLKIYLQGQGIAVP
ncbi:phosphatidate cytidylyltransferase [Flagelloscypha sp. PMI_526]|nr:phosphatidate cytidylyltransferase [Flagelloscypha sp. PMI_526]